VNSRRAVRMNTRNREWRDQNMISSNSVSSKGSSSSPAARHESSSKHRKSPRSLKKRELDQKRADMGIGSVPDLQQIRQIPILPRTLFAEDEQYKPDGTVQAWCIGAALDMDAIRDRFFHTDFILSSPSDALHPGLGTPPVGSRMGGLQNWLRRIRKSGVAATNTREGSSRSRDMNTNSNPSTRTSVNATVFATAVSNTNSVNTKDVGIGTQTQSDSNTENRDSDARGNTETPAAVSGNTNDANTNNANGGVAVRGINQAPPLELKITSVFDEVLFGKVNNADVFLFKFGVVVSWGLSEYDMGRLQKLLHSYVFQPATPSELESDEMKFIYWDSTKQDDKKGRAPIRKDTFPLVTSNTFEKVAYSYGFAQSTKLSVFESIIDRTIEKTKRIPESLARHGTTWLSRRNIAKQLGQLFVLRCNVNLQTDILDTPEILWDFDEWESLYMASKQYLGVGERVRIVNQRLDVIKDLYDILNDELGVQQSHREGLIIIALISLELLVEIFKELVDIPGIAGMLRDIPSMIQTASIQAPFKTFVLALIATAWIMSPLKGFFRSLRAKWQVEESLSVARAGGAMYLPSEENGMLTHMVGRLTGTGAEVLRRNRL